MSIFVKKDWTVLVVDAAKAKNLTPIQLQKALFLLGQKMPEVVRSDYYNFTPYNYGPFDKQIYADVEDLTENGLIDEISRPGQKWPEYRITAIGKEKAESLRKSASPQVVEYLDQLVTWIVSVSFHDLLHAVYSAYPDFAKNSVFNKGA